MAFRKRERDGILGVSWMRPDKSRARFFNTSNNYSINLPIPWFGWQVVLRRKQLLAESKSHYMESMSV